MEEVFVLCATAYAKIWITEKIVDPISDWAKEASFGNDIFPVKHALTLGLYYASKAAKFYAYYLIFAKKL